MPNPASPDFAALANQLGDFFLAVDEHVGNLIHEGVGVLPDDQLAALEGQLDQLTKAANSCFELAERIAFTDLALFLQGIQDSIDKINRELKTLADINKAIAITAAVVGLAVGVLTQNGAVLGQAVQTIGKI